jgi:hypothetical protein
MKLKHRCLSIASIGILFAASLAMPAAHAAWDFVPGLDIRARDEDNPLYLPDALSSLKQSGSSALLNMSVEMATYTDRGTLVFDPDVVIYKYAEKAFDDLNGTDWYFTGSGQYNWKTAQVGFDARFQRQRLATGEFGTINFNLDQPNPNTGDTGRVVFIDQYRSFYYLTPYVSFQLSPRNTLRFDLANNDTSYSGGDLSFRTGYKDRSLTTSLQRNVDEQTQVAAVMTVEDYAAQVNTNDFRTVTLAGTFQRPINPLWSFNMKAGVLRSDYTVVNVANQATSGATTDYVMTVGFRKRSERTDINFDLGRDVYPSSNGYTTLTREIRFAMNRKFTQRLEMNLGFSAAESKALGNLSASNDRHYGTVSMEFEWAIKPVLFLVSGLTYWTQDYPNDVLIQNRGTLDATSITLGVRYRGLSKRNPPKTR